MQYLYNKTQWKDTEEIPIQSHGGMILEYQGTYYWYGENKAGKTSLLPGFNRVDFLGISCYT